MKTVSAAPASTVHPGLPGAAELACAARRVADEIQVLLKRPDGWRLASIQQQLSESLRCPLAAGDFALIVSEVAALAWAETGRGGGGGGAAVRLPDPLRPIEGVLELASNSDLEAALAALRGLAHQIRIGGGLGEGELYEQFLATLDPDARSRHSVYSTPGPLVRMLVRSVEDLLEEELGLDGGLASPEVGLLDPAVGTGAFLLGALGQARLRTGRADRPRAPWLGFEVQPGAYVASSLRLGRYLEGSPTASVAPPVRLTLCDLLAPDSPLAGPSGGKWGTPRPSALVVLGNPPWSGTAASSPWVERLLKTGYERPDGTRDRGYYRLQSLDAGSRNTKWLRSRYVKFLRVAQWSVDQVGRGVVALVLSDGLVENLTMSGVRQSLLESFETIYLLDLGGNARKLEAQATDANLFDVKQGACALILVKGGAGSGVRTFALRGSRADKHAWLETQSVDTVPWGRLEPQPPIFSFRARSSRSGPCSSAHYWTAPSVRDVFAHGSIAVITGRDRLVVGFDERELLGRIGLLRQGRDGSHFGLETSGGFDPEEAIRMLLGDDEWQRRVVPYLLRPGDARVLFAAPYLASRPRRAVMAEIERPGNLALLLPRRRRAFPSAWVTDCAASHRVAAAYEGTYAFPLYVGADRRPNFSHTLLDHLERRYGELPAPEQLFGFLYARLWSRTHHERYVEELRQDWPRVLLPRSFERFSLLAGAGWKLVRIHLGSNPARVTTWLHGELPVRLAPQGKSFEHEPDGRLRLGLEGGYLAPVAEEVMAYRVGGYPLVSGWLRRRSGRELGARDIEELSELVEVIEATCRWQHELASLEDSNGT